MYGGGAWTRTVEVDFETSLGLGLGAVCRDGPAMACTLGMGLGPGLGAVRQNGPRMAYTSGTGSGLGLGAACREGPATAGILDVGGIGWG